MFICLKIETDSDLFVGKLTLKTVMSEPKVRSEKCSDRQSLDMEVAESEDGKTEDKEADMVIKDNKYGPPIDRGWAWVVLSGKTLF